MLNKIWSLIKTIPQVLTSVAITSYSVLKWFALFFGCLYLMVSIAEMLPPSGPMIPSIQNDQNMAPLVASDTIDYQKSLIRIYKDNVFHCSGVVIGKNYALTAAHCLVDQTGYIKEKKVFSVESEDSSVRVSADAVGVNTRMDWGLLKGDFSNIPGAYVMTKDFAIPPKVLSCGFPQGLHTLYCSVLGPITNDGTMIKSAGVIFPGMSGGPVFNEEGVVIGINAIIYPFIGSGGGSAFAPVIGIFSNFGIGD